MMKLPRSFSQRSRMLLVMFLLINFVVFSIYLFGEEFSLTESIQSSKDRLSFSLDEILNGYGSGNFIKGQLSSRNRKVLLPASFHFDRDALNHHLSSTSAKHWRVEQLRPKDILEVPPIQHGKFFQTDEAKLFNAVKEVPKDQCYSGIGERIPIVTDKIDIIPGDLRHIFEIYLEELDDFNDEYNEDIAPIFADHVRVQLKNNLITPYWFRLSGSSVWLKDYNVHLVVSRLVFSHQRNRVKSDASLVLAQIFDKDWKELNDVRLVFPTNKIDSADSPTFYSDGQDFYSHRFPRIMPVPFFHEYKKKGKTLLGPEDPRIFLVQNPKGYEEPVIVFNAEQVRMWPKEKDDKKERDQKDQEKDDKKEDQRDEEKEMEKKNSRNMFMSHLFQLQKGKNDVEKNDKADYKYFTKTRELMIAGEGRSKKEKNWTPIVSENQESLGTDRYVYFATQISDLKIIKCDILADTDVCEVDFEAKSSVGALRGGTPFVNLNQMLRKQAKYNIRRLIPEGREIWVSVARAHMSECGCSANFYRPNIVVLVRDKATYFDKEAQKFMKKDFWKISHVSSFFGMGVEIVPWHPDNANSICTDTNALIPNGIGTWSISDLDYSHGNWYADDVMTLFFSISDYTVDKINIKGLLHALLNTRDNSLFMNVPFAPMNRNLFQPVLNSKGELQSELPGFTNTNIECALEESKHFCKAYGDEQKENPKVFDPVEVSHAMDQMEDKLSDMKEALNDIGY